MISGRWVRRELPTKAALHTLASARVTQPSNECIRKKQPTQVFLFPIIFSLGEKEALTKGKKIKRGLPDCRVRCVRSALLWRSLRHWQCWKGTSLLPISLNSIPETLITSKARNLFSFFYRGNEASQSARASEPSARLLCSALRLNIITGQHHGLPRSPVHPIFPITRC